ncbi:MAG: hypothetical protein JNJ54_27820 [Myxococcaceae bacterium]|nr:hypothetical protein [Myxococcaceae bacterium]
MDAHVLRAALRFIQSLDRGVDAESFSDDDAWAFMQDLVYEFALPERSLHPAQVAALRDFGHIAGIRPGSPISNYAPGLEAALGPHATAIGRMLTCVERGWWGVPRRAGPAPASAVAERRASAWRARKGSVVRAGRRVPCAKAQRSVCRASARY